MKTAVLAQRSTSPDIERLVSLLAEKLDATVFGFEKEGEISIRAPGETTATPALGGMDDSRRWPIDDAWLALLAQYAARQVDHAPTLEDLDSYVELTRLLSRHGLDEFELIVAIDSASVCAALGAFAPFLAVVTELPDAMDANLPLPGALAFALHAAPMVVATNLPAWLGLVNRGWQGVHYCPVDSELPQPGEPAGVEQATAGPFTVLVSRPLDGRREPAAEATATPPPRPAGSAERVLEIAAALLQQAPEGRPGMVVLPGAADESVGSLAATTGLGDRLRWLGSEAVGEEPFRSADVVLVPSADPCEIERDVVLAAVFGKPSVLMEGLLLLNSIHQSPIPAIAVSSAETVDGSLLAEARQRAADWYQTERSLETVVSRLTGLARAVGLRCSSSAPLYSLQQKREELAYESRVAVVYDEKYHAGVCYQHIDQLLADDIAAALAGSRGPHRLLDLGCGPGSLFPFLKEIPNTEITGVDLSPEMIAVARARHPTVDLRVGDCEAIPWPDKSFDVVLCSGVLHHLPSLTATCKEIRRVLRGNGILLVREPSDDHFGSRHAEESWIHLCLRHHIYTALWRRLVEEPASHAFHREFTATTLVDALEPWFQVESLKTKLRVAYFYDAIRDPGLYAPVERLEASLDNQPGLHLIARARLTGTNGCDHGVRDKLAEMAPVQEITTDHLASIAEAVEFFGRRIPSNLPQAAALATRGWHCILPPEPARVLVLSDDQRRLVALAEGMPGERQCESLSLSLASSAGASGFDAVVVELVDGADEGDLLAAFRACREYGRFYLEVASGARVTGRTEASAEVLLAAVAVGSPFGRDWAFRSVSIPTGYTLMDARLSLRQVLWDLPERDEILERALENLEKAIRWSQLKGDFSALRAADAGLTLRHALDAL